MKFIKPSVEIIDEPDLFKRIEIGARNCWRSDDKICDGSAEKMFENLVKRGHESPMEHSNIIVETNVKAFVVLEEILNAYCYETRIPDLIKVSYNTERDKMICSGNLRAWRSLCRRFYDDPVLCYLFKDAPGFADIPFSTWTTDGELPYRRVDPSQIDDPRHTIVTARFICDRAVQNELVRHRLLGLSVESTRYVSYQDGLTFIEPWWWPEQENADTQFVRASCQAAEDAYCSMVKMGCAPQKARCVLPNMLKTEVVATGTVEYWQQYVLPLRLSKAAHHDMRRLMTLFCEQMNWDPNDFMEEKK